MANPGKSYRVVSVEGFTGLKDVHLVRFSGREQVSRPFEYELTLTANSSRGSDGAVDTDEILGRSVTVSLQPDSQSAARYFNGVVAEFAHTGYSSRYHEYRAVLRPAFWLLSQRADCRVFQKKSTPDIFADVCGHGLSIAHRLDLSGKYAPWEYRVQYHESDFDFLSRLLEHEGIYYYFEHSRGKHEIVLVDDVGKLKEVPGYKEVPYYPPSTTAAQRERDHLQSWETWESFQPAAFASAEYNFETPAAQVRAASPVAKRKDASKYEVFEYPANANPLNSQGVERLAKLRAERFHAAQAVARSRGDAAGLGAGRLFTLKNHPRRDFNKRYLVLSAHIEISSDAGQTGGEADGSGPQFSVGIEAVDAAAPYRPERVTQKPRIQGTQTARVVGPSGKEIWTDKYGRVKVQFPWDRAATDDGNSSCWVRVAQSWAGKNWGAQFVPRTGQEVIVSFLEGDPDRPIVIGSVFNAEHMPPYELPTNGTRSGVKTNTSPSKSADGFNELRFEDSEGHEEIYLHAEKDMQVVVENNQTISVGASKKDRGDRTTTVQNDDKLTVGNELSVTVKGKETRTVTKDRVTTAKENDQLDVSKQYTLKAGDQITLECGLAKIVMKKDGTVEISGKEVKVKGTMKASVDATQVAISGTQLEVKGTKTAVQGTGTLDLASSGIASLKGSLTKIG
jgi:type VI secretion system secreted protein VgrG